MDSDLYQKRMVRELNALTDGFYTNGHRYLQARFCKGQIQARSLDEKGKSVWYTMGTRQVWCDVFGQEVCASRSV